MRSNRRSDSKLLSIYEIVQDDVVNGPGIRASIFFSGCEHKCPGCHNPETWDRKNGQLMTADEIIGDFSSNKLISSVTFTGGDPVYQWVNAIELATKCRELYDNMILYTGFTFVTIKTMCKIKPDFVNFLKNFKYIIPEPYIANERNLSLAYRGSNNQRIYELNTIKSNIPEYRDVSDIWDKLYCANL